MESLKQIEERPAFFLKPIRHGFRARAIMAPGENRRDFNELCDDLEREWRPRTRTEHFYLEQMAVSQWKLYRLQIAEYDTMQENEHAAAQIPALERLWQCQNRLERSYTRAQRDLEHLQKSRPHPAPPPRDEDPDPPPAPAVEATQPRPIALVIDISTATQAPNPPDSPELSPEPAPDAKAGQCPTPKAQHPL